jgi:Fungal trichothecene efflux pump (TRI12)
LTLVITGLAGANLFALGSIWPLQCQILFGPDFDKLARVLLPSGFSVLIALVVVNWCVSIFRGANRELMVISSAMMVAGMGSMAVITPDKATLATILGLIGGFGTGGLIQPAATILMIITPDEALATITALTLSVRLVGASIGYAVYFNIFYNKLAQVLPGLVSQAVIGAGGQADQIGGVLGALVTSNYTALGNFAPRVQLAAQQAYLESNMEGFRSVYLVAIGVGGLAVITSAFLGDIRKFMSDRIAVDIH